MLDAYIIDRIRREQERGRQNDAQIPLHIDEPSRRPRDDAEDRDRRDRERDDRGSVVIDFHV